MIRRRKKWLKTNLIAKKLLNVELYKKMGS